MKLPFQILLVAFVTLGMFLSDSSIASADHDRALVAAARQFKDACKGLEIEVMRTRYIDRADVHLVNDYEAHSIALHGAAHNTRDLDRLFRKWDEVSRLHHRVERTLFASGFYPYNAKLARCWQSVQLAYQNVGGELNWLQGGVGGRYYADRVPVTPPILSPRAIAVPRVTIESYRAPLPYSPRHAQRPTPRTFCPTTGLPVSPYRGPSVSPYGRPGSTITVPIPSYRPALPRSPVSPAPALVPPKPFEVSIPRHRGVESLSRRTYTRDSGRTISVGALLSRYVRGL